MSSRPPAPKTVLIVEDNEDIRYALRDALEFEGFTVETATNGQEGFEKLRALGHACLILLDYRMPIMDGQEFLKILRADQDFSSLPVIMLSAHADSALVIGANEFMRKPLNFEILTSRVEKYLAAC